MEHYETEEYRGFVINIDYDSECESPREWCNLSHMICWHRNYCIGDKHDYRDESSFFDSLTRQYVSRDAVKHFIMEHKGDCWLEKQDECYILHDGENDYYDAQYDLDADINDIAEQAFDYLSDQDKYVLVEASDEIVISTISYYDHSGISVWIGSPNDCWDSGRCGWIYQTKQDTIKSQSNATEENWKEAAWKNMEAEMKVYDEYVTGQCFGYTVEDEDGDCIDSCWGYVGRSEVEQIKTEAKDIIDCHIQQATEKRNNLISYMTSNYDKLPEEQIFVSGDTAYRTDRNNLFKMLQFTSAPIKNNVIGVFDSTDFSSVPTVMLECMQSAIQKQSQMQTV